MRIVEDSSIKVEKLDLQLHVNERFRGFIGCLGCKAFLGRLEVTGPIQGS